MLHLFLKSILLKQNLFYFWNHFLNADFTSSSGPSSVPLILETGLDHLVDVTALKNPGIESYLLCDARHVEEVFHFLFLTASFCLLTQEEFQWCSKSIVLLFQESARTCSKLQKKPVNMTFPCEHWVLNEHLNTLPFWCGLGWNCKHLCFQTQLW